MATTTWIILAKFHNDIDGKYQLDWQFKKRHWRTIKKMADVTPPELVRELERNNVDLAAALAAVALEQAGKPYIPEMLWSDEGEIMLTEEKDPDASPPDQASSPKPDESTPPSGEPMSASGELSPETTTQNGSGHPGSETGADSVPAISETSLPTS